MNANEFIDYLLEKMNRAKLASGNSVINCRCPECGDSHNITSAHFYIKVPDGKSPLWYYCHKCNCKGVVDYKKIIEWDIYTPEVAQFVHDYGLLTARNSRTKYNNRTVYNIRHTKTSNNACSEIKKQYICERLGVNLSYEELASLKIIVNLYDLLEENGINKLTRNKNIVDQLNEYFIGFLSIDNAFLNMRRTCKDNVVYKSIDKRYINYSLLDKQDTNQRFYTIPTCVDISGPERIKLHISEGPFDILSVYLNLRNREPGIYTCVAGNNYISVIMYFLIELRLPNLELHFYPDNDRYGTIERMESIMNLIPDKTIPIYVHINTKDNEKDFGVPRDRINEAIQKLR